jgi:hypothetical protein
MPAHMKKVFGILPVLLLLFVFSASPAFAVALDAIGIASYYPINEKNVENGDIISSSVNGYYKTKVPYDAQVVGVITLKPAISLRTTNDKNMFPIVNAGIVNVKVSGANGNLKKGQFITSSDIPGTAMKATTGGYVLGSAMEDVSFSGKKDVKLVTIDLNVHYLQIGSPVASSLQDVFNLSRLATYEQPIRVFQYVAATLVLVISFIFGFLIFAKVVNTGVEALGRNPLAGKMIQLSIVFNVILIIAIILAGASIAYLIIRL